MGHRGRRSGAFTLVEMAIVLVVIAIVVSILFVALGGAVREGRLTSERQFLNSLRVGVEQFRQEFGFLPPLVVDGPPTTPGDPGPLSPGAPRRPVARDDAFLRYEGDLNQPRYSEYSLTYYLMGVLDLNDGSSGGGKPVDGVPGPGFTRPNRDGSFSQRGAPISPMYDPGAGGQRLRRDPQDPEKVSILDRWGNPVRFYRWLPSHHASGPRKGEVRQLHIPRSVPVQNPQNPGLDPALRNAEFAIISLGPDGRTDDRLPFPFDGNNDPSTLAFDSANPGDYDFVKDNLAEVGR